MSEAGVRFKMGAFFRVLGWLKSGASGLRPVDGLRRPGRRSMSWACRRRRPLARSACRARVHSVGASL